MSGIVCTPQLRGSVACFERATVLSDDDLLSGMQQHGPDRDPESAGISVGLLAQFIQGGGIGGPFLPLTAGIRSLAESGAIGDGFTDDQPVIQAWLNTLTVGAEVVMPPGKWYAITSATLTIPPNVWIHGSYNNFGSNVDNDFFGGGGFLLNPALPIGIAMSGPSSLTNTKVYRQGLVANPTTAQSDAAQLLWASEAFWLQTTVDTDVGLSVLPFADTTGVTVGVPVWGTHIPDGTTVVSKTSTTVTISAPVFSRPLLAKYYVRFGGSIGIRIGSNVGGVVLQNLVVIGFNVGIQTVAGQFLIEYIQADCITCLESYQGGSVCHAHKFMILPWYGLGPVVKNRPGPAIFLHDGDVSNVMDNNTVSRWLIGVKIANTGGIFMSNGFAEHDKNDTNVTTSYLLENCSALALRGCWAQTPSIGFHVIDSSNWVISNPMVDGGNTTGNAVAHYLVEGPNVPVRGSLFNPWSIFAQVVQAPFMLNAGITYMKMPSPHISGSVYAGGPDIQIDPSVTFHVDRISVRDADSGTGTDTIIQTLFNEKVYVVGNGTATTDGSPTGSLTVALVDGLTTQAQIMAFLRATTQVLSIEATVNDTYIIPKGDLHLGFTNHNTWIPSQLNVQQWVIETTQSHVTPSSGDTITWGPGHPAYIIDTVSTLTALNVVLPALGPDGAAIVSGLRLQIVTNSAITTLTLSTTDGSTIAPGGGPTTMAAGSAISFRYQSTPTPKWFTSIG